MTTYPMRAPARKPFRLAEIQLELFAWADAQAASAFPPSLAEQHLARRFGVSPWLARVVGELAQLGGRA